MGILQKLALVGVAAVLINVAIIVITSMTGISILMIGFLMDVDGKPPI